MKDKTVQISILNNSDKRHEITLFDSHLYRCSVNYGLPMGVSPLSCRIDDKDVSYIDVLVQSELSPYAVIGAAHTRRNIPVESQLFKQAKGLSITRAFYKAQINGFVPVKIKIPAKKIVNIKLITRELSEAAIKKLDEAILAIWNQHRR
jgi:hypothetical protein